MSITMVLAAFSDYLKRLGPQVVESVYDGWGEGDFDFDYEAPA